MSDETLLLLNFNANTVNAYANLWRCNAVPWSTAHRRVVIHAAYMQFVNPSSEPSMVLNVQCTSLIVESEL